jgi:hypothetical protein
MLVLAMLESQVKTAVLVVVVHTLEMEDHQPQALEQVDKVMQVA